MSRYIFPPFMRKMSYSFPPPPDPAKFTNLTRPNAADYPPGAWIWNLDDNAPNWSDGTNWRDSDGNIT